MDLRFACLNSHKHFKCSICKSKEHSNLTHCEESVSNFANTSQSTKSTVLLPTIKARFKRADGSSIIARGIVDSGSQISLCTTRLIEQLGAVPFNYNVNLIALGQKKQPIAKAIHLSFYSMHDDYSCNSLFSVVDNVQLHAIAIPDTIKLAEDLFNIPSDIDFLVSADIFFRIMLPDKIELSRDLVLLSTKFGYIVSGKINQDNVTCLLSQGISNERVALHAVNNNNIDSLLQKFWDEQHIPETQKEGIANQQICETEFKRSAKLTDLLNSVFRLAYH